jgi:hypothetical protein
MMSWGCTSLATRAREGTRRGEGRGGEEEESVGGWGTDRKGPVAARLANARQGAKSSVSNSIPPCLITLSFFFSDQPIAAGTADLRRPAPRPDIFGPNLLTRLEPVSISVRLQAYSLALHILFHSIPPLLSLLLPSSRPLPVRSPHDHRNAMGKSQSKLTPEQLSDLQKNTYCESPSHFFPIPTRRLPLAASHSVR